MTLIKLVGQGVSVAEAARQVGLSRKTAYKWLERARSAGGDAGALMDRSRARLDIERFEGPVADELLARRREHPTWGPRKLLDVLRRERRGRDQCLPAASTVGALLKREGLVLPRVRRPSYTPFRYAGPAPVEPNKRWTVDFKGEFRLGDGSQCLPLTLRDAASRRVFGVWTVPSTHQEPVQRHLTRCFRDCGMPWELQSDGGPPFATTGVGRLSKLGVWLMKLDVCPVLSRPGKPQDNGGHERMHRDLKAETTRPPCMTAATQQRRFNRWVRDFNELRPHEALDGDTPASRWVPSTRPFPEKIAEWDYPGWWSVRRVNRSLPEFSWKNRAVRINDALAGEAIALEPIDDALWRIHFRNFAIGLLDSRSEVPKVLSLVRVGGKLDHAPRG